MSNLKLNDQITFLRKQKGVTQEELANVLDVTNQAVSKWESAQCCPDIQLLPKIAKYFDVSIDELMGYSVEKLISEDKTTFAIDPKIDDAVRIAKETGRISTSILQRKLLIGYSRSVNIINYLEKIGYIVKDSFSTYKSYIWNDINKD